MKKTAVVTVPLVTILLLLELASAKPIGSPENLQSQNALTKPIIGLTGQKINLAPPEDIVIKPSDSSNTVAPNKLASAKPIGSLENLQSQNELTKPAIGLTEQKINHAIPEDIAINPLDSIDAVAPDSEKINDYLNSNKSNPLSLPSISGGEKNVISNVKPGSEKPNRSPTSSELSPERPSGLVIDLMPDSSKTDSLRTTSEPVSKGEDTFSSATSLKPDSKEPDNSVTTLQPLGLSTTLNGGSGESDTLPTTSKSDTDRERRENLGITSMPSSHQHHYELPNLPVTSETRSRASDIGSPCMMVLLGVLLITGSQVT